MDKTERDAAAVRFLTRGARVLRTVISLRSLVRMRGEMSRVSSNIFPERYSIYRGPLRPRLDRNGSAV